MQNSPKIINRFLATINALKAGFRAAIGEDRVPEPALIRRGFTNIPKCIVSRLMQRCTSSDTLALRGSLTFSFHPSPSTVPRPLFHRPVHASHAVSVSFIPFQPASSLPSIRARGPRGIPTSRDYFRFYPRRGNCAVVYGHGFPKNSNIKSSAVSAVRRERKKERKKGAARERTRSWRKIVRIVSPSNACISLSSFILRLHRFFFESKLSTLMIKWISTRWNIIGISIFRMFRRNRIFEHNTV